jgi:hypothetical protein
MSEGSGWQSKAEWYQKENNKKAKILLKIKKMIESLNLESGWMPNASPS